MIAEVWAPSATRVRIRADDAERELARDPERPGWWRDDRDLAPGTRYGFVLGDDADAIPDPRGRFLPDGVHGLSEVVDIAPPPRWHGRELAGGVIYELHIGTFTPAGTLDSAIERLDHLVDLGVDFVELLPVNGFNGDRNWGYDGVAWYAVDDSYGGPAAYVRFVAAAHERGLAVIQDVVYNHLGPSGNYLPRFGPYLTEGGNTWGDNVNLGEPAVRAYILDNTAMWMRDYGVDGLRLDAVHALVDPTDRHLLADLADRTAALEAEVGRPLTLIAESDLNDPVMITPTHEADGQPGYGMTAQWSDDYHHAVHVALTGETTGYYEDFASLDALAKAATHGFFHDGTWSSFRETEHGKPIPQDVPTWRLVTFAQDHDQIGNRATGDRLSQIVDADILAVGAVLSLASPFTPMLFMGEEWGASTPWQFFTGHPEQDLGKATAEGRIAEFAKMGWDPATVPDPQDPDTFARSHLDWSELEGAGPDAESHRRLLALHRDLIALRHREPAFADPAWDILEAEADDAARTFRLRQGDLLVLANLGDAGWRVRAGELLLGTRPEVVQADGHVVLPPRSAGIARIA